MTRLKILMYHGVGTPDFPARAFERQIRALKAAYDIVPIDRALESLESDRAIGSTKLLLTFDDGLRNNCTVAYPILAKLAVPCVFYVCPGLIDSRIWVWTHEARARLSSISAHARTRLAMIIAAAGDEVDLIVDVALRRRDGDRACVDPQVARQGVERERSARRERPGLVDRGPEGDAAALPLCGRQLFRLQLDWRDADLERFAHREILEGDRGAFDR